MRRTMLGIAVALGAALLLLAPSSAHAIDYPASNTSIRVVSGQFAPGGTGTLTVDLLTPDLLHTGTINSAPIAVSGTTDASGTLVLAGFAVPADFALVATHSVTLTGSGETAKTASFCVNSSGAVADCSSALGATATTAPAAALPRTGSNHIMGAVQIAIAAIAAGALLLMWRRRRITTS